MYTCFYVCAVIWPLTVPFPLLSLGIFVVLYPIVYNVPMATYVLPGRP